MTSDAIQVCPGSAYRIQVARNVEPCLRGYALTVPTIAASLSDSASAYAKRALQSYVTEDTRDFMLFGGIAIEHAIKAELARQSPQFLSASGKFKSSIDLYRSNDNAALLPAGTQTVGAREALERLIQLQPESAAFLAPAREVLALRNGEVHLAVADETQRRRTIVVFLRAIEGLLRIDPAEFWSPHEDVAKGALDDDIAETVRLVTERMAAARISFDRTIASLPSDQKVAILAIIERQRDAQSNPEDHLAMECPVCDSACLMHGITEQTDWDIDYDRDGLPEARWPVLTFFAGTLECNACGLVLDGSEEIKAAALETSWMNDWIDLETWMQENVYDDAY